MMDKEYNCEDLLGGAAEPDILTLSPIIEMSESILIDSSMSDEQLEGSYLNVQDESFSQSENGFALSDSHSHQTNVKRPLFLELPETPPEILRQQISVLKKQYQHFMLEHDELREFTQLEKQVYHHDCVPKDEVHSLKDEIDSLNEKIQHLIQENLNFRNELEKKESEDQDLKNRYMTLLNNQKLFEKYASQIGQKLKENLQHGAEEVVKVNPYLEMLILDNDDSEDVDILKNPENLKFLNALEGIQNLTELVITEKQLLKDELGKLYVKNMELELSHKQISQKNELFQNCLNNTKSQITNLQETLSASNIQEKQLKGLLTLSESKLKERMCLLNAAELDKECLQNKLKNVKSLDSVQEEFAFILNEVKLIFDNSNDSTFRSVFLGLQGKEKQFLCVDRILNSNNRAILFEILCTLDQRIIIYDDNVKRFVTETEKLKSDVKSLRLQDIKDICDRMDSLENTLVTTCDENVCLKEKLTSLEEEKKKLTSALANVKHEFEIVAHLPEMTLMEKGNIESQIDIFQNDLQNSYILVLNEIGNIINSWDLKKGLKDLINILEIDKSMLKSDNVFLHSNTKTVLHDVLNKLKTKMISFDTEIQLRIQEFATRTKVAEEEINELTGDMELLKKTVKDELIARVFKLECSAQSCKDDKVRFKDKSVGTDHGGNEIGQDCIESRSGSRVNNVQKELTYVLKEFDKYLDSGNHHVKEEFALFLQNNKDCPCLGELVDRNINNLLLNCFYKLDTKLCSFEEENCKLMQSVEDASLNIKILTNENHNLKKRVRDLENVYNSEPAKQLAVLKELLVIEISSLDSTESKDDLVTYSSEDIFNKFMQCILKKEAEILVNLQEHYETNHKKTQDGLDTVNKKIKTQQSWITEIENENNRMSNEIADLKQSKLEMESKIKTLSNNLKNSSTEMSTLKTNILLFTSKNTVLKNKLKMCNQFLANEKDTVNELKSNLKELKEDTKLKTEEILNINAKLTALVSTQTKRCKCFRDKVSLKSEAFLENQNSTEEVIDECLSINTECSLKRCNTFDSTCKGIAGTDVFIQNLEEEKSLLKDLLLSNDLKYMDGVFYTFVILKDVVQTFFNKILELENLRAKTQSDFQNTVDTVSKDLNDLKLSLLQLHKEFVPDNETSKSDVNLDLFGNIFSLKKELELVEEECLQVNKIANQCQNDIQSGQLFINGLKEQFKIIVYETSRKDILIEELYRTIAIEQHKNTEKESEFEAITKQVNNLLLKNTQLGKEITFLNVKLSDINLILSSILFDLPAEVIDLQGKINYINNIFKENLEIKYSITVTNESIGFFSHQCSLMNSYIKMIEHSLFVMLLKNKQFEDQIKYLNLQLSDTNLTLSNLLFDNTPGEMKGLEEKITFINNLCKESIESKSSIIVANECLQFFSDQCNLMNSYIMRIEHTLFVLQGQKEQSDDECNLIRDQLANTSKHLDEANMAFKHLISVLPSKPSTPMQAMSLVQSIINDNTSLKESEENLLQKQKATETAVSSQTEEIKCLKNLNSNLKTDLGKCEDFVRNLRSELRTLRSQYQKIMAESASLTNCEATDFGMQTDILCCRQLQHEMSILNEKLTERNNKITCLEGQIRIKSSPYKRKTFNLELAHAQAKERIKELNLKLAQQVNYNKDLIELYQPQETYTEFERFTQHLN